MKTRNNRLGPVLVLGMLALVATGCDDSDLTAPGDATIRLTAETTTIVIDPDAGETFKTIKLLAEVFDSEGKPLQGVRVTFAVTGGGGTISPSSDSTDSSGAAEVEFTMTINDPPGAQIVATSSGVESNEVDIVLQVLSQNGQPQAGAVASPPDEQILGRPVVFDGSISSDPDNDPLTCYQWTMDSNIDTNDLVIQGPGASAFDFTFTQEQRLFVTLRVSDNVGVGAQCAAVRVPPGDPQVVDQNLMSPLVAKIIGSDGNGYAITCDNVAPTADAGPDVRQVVSNPFVQLDGRRSVDSDGQILTYLWSCGNGFPPSPSASSPIVTCAYNFVGVYQAVLTVSDNGTDGTIDPQTGRPFCQKSDSDEAIVEIFAP